MAFVVDEAHRVKKWGETFRRERSPNGNKSNLINMHAHMNLDSMKSDYHCYWVCKNAL